MVNFFTQKDVPDSAVYYDLPAFRPFWATVAALDVPIYLHPQLTIPSRATSYEGHRWLYSAALRAVDWPPTWAPVSHPALTGP